MSDRLCAIMSIGGQVRQKKLSALLKAIAEAGVGTEWGDPTFAPASAEELLLALKDGRIRLCDDQASYGAFPELEKTCRKLRLPYRRHTEGKYEFDAEIVDYRPGMRRPLVRMGSNNNENETFVAASHVKKALDLLEAGKVEQAIKILRELCPEVAPLPPFEIV